MPISDDKGGWNKMYPMQILSWACQNFMHQISIFWNQNGGRYMNALFGIRGKLAAFEGNWEQYGT